MVTEKHIARGAYVCEYRTYRVYPVGSDLHHQMAKEYAENGEGSYVMDTAYRIPNIGRLCFDATRRYRDVGRLINHSSRRPNLKLTRPLHVRCKWRVALLATRDITPGEEITYDYGVRNLSWTRATVANQEQDDGRPPFGEGEEEGSKVEEGAGGIEGVEERSRGTGGEEELAEGAGGEEEGRREEEGSEGARRLDGEQLAGKCLPEVGQRAGVPSTRDEERREDEGSEEVCRLDGEELAGRRLPEVGFKVQRAGGPSTREDECVGGREGELDHMEIVLGGDGGQVGEGDLVEDNGGEVESEEETKEESLEGGRRRSTTGYKRNYYWCPVVDCASGPVQKMGQHLVKVHKMDRATATRTAKKKKKRATPEAIKLKLPNPTRRSSGIKSISLFSTPAPSSSTPKPTSKTSGTHSKTTSSLALAHSGGPFLEEFQSHLKTHAGGYRSSSTATQLARDVGKYLYFLDQSEVNEALLLDTHPVEGYLQSLSASGMGPSGSLHRLLSQKAAIHFMKLTVSCPSHQARARANTHDCSPPQMEDDAQIRKADRCMQHLSAIYKSYNRAKAKKGRYMLLQRTLEGVSDSMTAVHGFREDGRVLDTFRANATAILRGHLSRSRYATCLGLLAARLMYL